MQIKGLLFGRWARQAASMLLGVWLCVAPGHAENAASIGNFRRGIAVAHLFGWAPVEPSPSHNFIFPPFGSSANTSEPELKSIHDTGFDFVRLAVDPGPFLQFRGAQRDQLDAVLLERLNLILSSGLSVIVDFHPSDLQPDYTASALTRGVDTPVFRDYVRLLVRTASLLERLPPDKIALEIMNEPPVTPAQWQPMLEAAYQAIRDRARHLSLVLDGGDEGGAKGIVALGTFASDPATLLSFHYYDPYQFTHQGAPWVAARYLADVPYPALTRSLQDSLGASADLIAASGLSLAQKSAAIRDVQQRLDSYRRSAFDRGTIAKSFDRISGWAHDHDVPTNRIFLGEFGARKQDGALGIMRSAERAHWFSDVRQEAEAHGFPWAAWVYQGAGGFSLLRDDEDTELNPEIMQALGFPGRCSPSANLASRFGKC